MVAHPLGYYATRYLATTGTLVGVTTLCLASRLYVRTFMIRAWSADDYLLIATWVTFMGMTLCHMLMGIAFRSVDTIQPPIDVLQRFGTLVIMGEPFYLMTQIFLKSALAAFFLRMVLKPWQRRTIIYSVVIFVLFNAVYLFIALFSCGAPSWKHVIFPHKCAIPYSTVAALDYVAAVMNCLTDWIMALCPLFVISHLNLTKKAKTSVLILTVLGLSGSLISIARLPLIHALSDKGNEQYPAFVSTFILVSNIESGVGIVCLSLAALKPLMSAVIGSMNGSRFATVSAISVNEILSTSTAWLKSKRRSTLPMRQSRQSRSSFAGRNVSVVIDASNNDDHPIQSPLDVHFDKSASKSDIEATAGAVD